MKIETKIHYVQKMCTRLQHEFFNINKIKNDALMFLEDDENTESMCESQLEFEQKRLNILATIEKKLSEIMSLGKSYNEL